ncbi:MAG: ABC transporter permease [Clostridiaceae bacterium]|nr:ABC transporter permease [Clostridiaceae bacterium]
MTKRKVYISMKIRTMRLLVKEGTYNIYKNKLMTTASILTVAITLFFLGIVLLLAINLTSNIEVMKRDLDITVFLNVSASDFEREEVAAYIEGQIKEGKVSTYRFESREQAFENIKSELKNEALLKGLTPSNMPESFYIKLTDPELSEQVISDLTQFTGVNTEFGIGYNKDRLERLEGILRAFNYVLIFLLVVLSIVAIFLISNTIRLTVFARRREIEIMKYVGALDNFIRLPFIVEGILIGLIGAVISYFLTHHAYEWLQHMLNSILLNLGYTTLRLMEFSPVAFRIFVIYGIFGVVIGGIGSLLSVRKHLNV